MNPVDIILASAPEEIRKLEVDENYLITISVKNSEEVEKLIKADPKYHFSESKENFLKLWEEKNHKLDLQDCYNVVKAIASENRTRTADKYSLIFAQYMNSTDFFNRVIEGDIKLVDDMFKYVVDNKGRRDKSLASKICKYLNEWICNGNAYSINDHFVRDVLPYYLKKHGVDEKTWKGVNFESISYVSFVGYISALEEKVGCLNKNLIDHILWYGYRSDPIRCAIAKTLGQM